MRRAGFAVSLVLLLSGAACDPTPPIRARADALAAQRVESAAASAPTASTALPPAPAGPAVSARRDACERACANVASVLEAEIATLPEGREMLAEEMKNATGALCIERCEKLGDPASIACITAARSMLEIGGCEGQGPPR
jgi:hypothetical protein